MAFGAPVITAAVEDCNPLLSLESHLSEMGAYRYLMLAHSCAVQRSSAFLDKAAVSPVSPIRAALLIAVRVFKLRPFPSAEHPKAEGSTSCAHSGLCLF